MNTIQLRYFASIREAIGTGTERFSTAAPTLAALRDELIARGGAHAEALARGKAVRATLVARCPRILPAAPGSSSR